MDNIQLVRLQFQEKPLYPKYTTSNQLFEDQWIVICLNLGLFARYELIEPSKCNGKHVLFD